jgi:hypothetical protein
VKFPIDVSGLTRHCDDEPERSGLVYVRFDDELLHDATVSKLDAESACWVEDYPGGAAALVDKLREMCREQRLASAYAAYEGGRPVVCWVEAT